MAPRPPSTDALTAVRRFGLGPRPGEIAQLAADPRGALLRQLADPRAALITDRPQLQASHKLQMELQDLRLMRQVVRVFGSGAGGTPGAGADVRTGATVRERMREEAEARIGRARTTPSPLVERLVYFWSNHFTVALRKVRIMTGAYEREAIRPHVLGKFGDMLKAVVQHPAMLMYLDNHASIGPNSKAGRRAADGGRNRGLNENLAREILELHTLGVDGGYTQADVTNFARILTGWSVALDVNASPETAGRFQFVDNRHEPGRSVVLGKTYGESGVEAGLGVLDDLARHPATARHIATRLVRHFVSDRPPASLVAKLERAFKDSGGDLALVTKALVTAPEAWVAPAQKIVPPFDFLIALQRGFGFDVPVNETVRLSNLLGQPLWNPPSPKGWPDDDDAWISPSPIRERLRIAELVARRSPARDPRTLVDDLLADTAGESTRLAVVRAENREQALELLIMSPEFMRR